MYNRIIPNTGGKKILNQSWDWGRALDKLRLQIADSRLSLLEEWCGLIEEYARIRLEPTCENGLRPYVITINLCLLFRLLASEGMNFSPRNCDANTVSGIKFLLLSRQKKNYAIKILRDLRGLLEYAVESGKTAFNPLTSDQIPREERIARLRVSPNSILPVAEEFLDGTHYGNTYGTALLLMAHTGLRGLEFWRLRVSDFVPYHEVLGPHLMITGKFFKERVTPLTVNFSKFLRDYIRITCRGTGDDFLFHTEGDNQDPLRYKTMLGHFAKSPRRRLDKLPTINFRNLRRGLARDLHTSGMSLHYIQFLYDHRFISTTKLYVGKDEVRLRRELRTRHPAYMVQRSRRRPTIRGRRGPAAG
jgi:site-specific recombinase XerD